MFTTILVIISLIVFGHLFPRFTSGLLVLLVIFMRIAFELAIWGLVLGLAWYTIVVLL